MNDAAGHSSEQAFGLIAGQGQLPVLVARGMKERGHRVCCVGLRGQYNADLPPLCDEFREAGIMQPGRWARLLRRWNARQAVMVGRVAKTRMHDPLMFLRNLPDYRALKLWFTRLRHDRRNAAILSAVAEDLAENGITLIDSTTHIPEHMATEGPIGSCTPTDEQQKDIAFGWPLLHQTVELDIGQSMAVRGRDVLAVEAAEGTDRMIERAGQLSRAKGWTLLKTASSHHDNRADVPTIGVETVQRLHDAGGTCIGVGVGKVILVDKPNVIATADTLGIAILGIAD